MSAPFLEGCQPPWVVFPEIQPDELARHLEQGAAEVWFDEVWRPFWRRLSEGERAEYLTHWQASDDWREAIRFHFDAPDFDLEADAAESAAYLEQVRRRPSR